MSVSVFDKIEMAVDHRVKYQISTAATVTPLLRGPFPKVIKET